MAVRLTRWLAVLTMAPPGALALADGVRRGAVSPWLYAMTLTMLVAPALFFALRPASLRVQSLAISSVVTAITWFGLLHFGPTLAIGTVLTTSCVCWTLFFGRSGMVGGITATLFYVALIGWADTRGVLDFVVVGEPRDPLVWLRRWIAVAGNVTFVCGVTHVTWRCYQGLLLAESAARSRALEATRARDEFLALASHELRTPLTSLTILVQSLAAGQRVDARTVESLGRQVRRIERLVTTLSDVTSLDAGRALARRTFDLAALTREVIGGLARTSRSTARVSLYAPQVVRGRWDRALVEQLVAQVIGNAVKFGLGRPIDVRVEGDEADARIIVRDRGEGVPSADRERIFERFQRGVSWTHYGGLGLGLYLAQKIARMHGGDLVLDGDSEIGSSFTVVLPRAAEGPADAL